LSKILPLFMKVKIHPLFWLVAVPAALTARFYELILLFLLVFIHEWGHALAASFFSWRVKAILILPFGGVVETDEFGSRPIRQEALVALAGPLQHLWLGGLFLVLHRFSLLSDADHALLQKYNWMIFFFNCLPVYPLDGGKIFYLAAALVSPFFTAFKRTLVSSFVILTILFAAMLFFAPYHFNGWVIALFLYAVLWRTWKNRNYIFLRFLLAKYTGADGAKIGREKGITAKASENMRAVLEKFHLGFRHTVIVKGNGEVLGTFGERELLEAFFTGPFRKTLKDMLK